MKIVHICPIFTDGLSYQENYLTKYHRKDNNDVAVLTSKWIYDDKGKINLSNESKNEYINNDGVKIKRLDIKNNKDYCYKFKTYNNLYKEIEKENPDILFIHGVQWIFIDTIIKYKKKNKKVKIYIDNHADFSNSATNWISKYILHRIIWKYYAKKIESYVEKFYGVLPARVDFLINEYGIKKENVELLVMGADDELVNQNNNVEKIKKTKKELDIKDEDFIIVTGGKIDSAKRQTLYLMDAINELNLENVKLIIFGSVEDEIKKEFDKKIKDEKIKYIGWIDSKESYKYFAIANLVCFPGRHSVFWEQAAGQGKPMLVKYWNGTNHIDCGGNVEFIYNDTLNEYIQKIENIILNEDFYRNMCETSNISKETFLYSKISKKSLECEVK